LLICRIDGAVVKRLLIAAIGLLLMPVVGYSASVCDDGGITLPSGGLQPPSFPTPTKCPYKAVCTACNREADDKFGVQITSEASLIWRGNGFTLNVSANCDATSKGVYNVNRDQQCLITDSEVTAMCRGILNCTASVTLTVNAGYRVVWGDGASQAGATVAGTLTLGTGLTETLPPYDGPPMSVEPPIKNTQGKKCTDIEGDIKTACRNALGNIMKIDATDWAQKELENLGKMLKAIKDGPSQPPPAPGASQCKSNAQSGGCSKCCTTEVNAVPGCKIWPKADLTGGACQKQYSQCVNACNGSKM
jgi:hypothetical protein